MQTITPAEASTAAGRVRGVVDAGVCVFRGVPYGADTGGANRWRPPAPAPAWRDLRETVAPGPICPQRVGAPLPEETALLQSGPMSEDCLTLSIWTPATDALRRPVMVWLHGGGFSSGSGGAAPYDGARLCARQDVVLVSVTHRLGVLGFLDLRAIAGPEDAAVANVGLLDCVAALRWVRDNVAAFGGDPDRVTLFGQSGGGAKVAALLGTPAARGLVHRAIIQSAAGLRPVEAAEAAAAARALVQALGVGGTAELRAIPADTVVQAANTRGLRFGPVVDAEALPANPFAPAQWPATIPILFGTTLHEATFLPGAPLEPASDADAVAWLAALATAVDATGIERLLAAAAADAPAADPLERVQRIASLIFMHDAVMLADARARRGGAPVYNYLFTHRVAARDGRLGATHTAEIAYVFDSLARATPLVGPVTASEQRLADAMSAAWATFARAGAPRAPALPSWAAYAPPERLTLVIDDGSTMEADPMGLTRTVLEQILRG